MSADTPENSELTDEEKIREVVRDELNNQDEDGEEISRRDFGKAGILAALGLGGAAGVGGRQAVKNAVEPAQATHGGGSIGTESDPVGTIYAHDFGSSTEPIQNLYTTKQSSLDVGTLNADEQFINVATDTEPGFLSGLQTEYVNASTAAIQPGTAIASDDQTIIRAGSTLNADISTTGAGGRQSGLTEQASSWYELYVIADSNGDSPAAYLVEESQSFSYPSGYSTKRRVGWVRNNSTSDLAVWYQHGPRFWWDQPDQHQALNTTSPATTATNLDLSPHIPPSATHAVLRALSTGDGTAAVHYVNIRGAQQVEGAMVEARGWAGHGARDAAATGVTPVDSTQTVTYVTGASGDTIIRVNGWIDPR